MNVFTIRKAQAVLVLGLLMLGVLVGCSGSTGIIVNHPSELNLGLDDLPEAWTLVEEQNLANGSHYIHFRADAGLFIPGILDFRPAETWETIESWVMVYPTVEMAKESFFQDKGGSQSKD